MRTNLERVERVAKRLGALREEVVFLGGAVTELLVTDLGAPEPRVTVDVDAIVEVANRGEYHDFTSRLRAAGFSEDSRDGAPICRWIVDGYPVDLMPTDEKILGFSNRWYGDTIRHAEWRALPGGTAVRVTTAPFFLATKLEAFKGRGAGDFSASHDIEDVISVVDGRSELVGEVWRAGGGVQAYLAREFDALLTQERFRDSLPGHLPSDLASQARLSIVVERLVALTRRG